MTDENPTQKKTPSPFDYSQTRYILADAIRLGEPLPKFFVDRPDVDAEMLDVIARNFPECHLHIAQLRNKPVLTETLKHIYESTDHGGSDKWFVHTYMAMNPNIKDHLEVALMLADSSDENNSVAIGFITGVIHEHLEPYRNWPLEWVKAHFNDQSNLRQSK